MEITYIIESLANSGGMERVVSQKASWLADNTNNNITIISFAQKPGDIDYFALSNKVKRVRWNLFGTKVPADLQRLLGEWLRSNPQDICISTYGSEFSILHKIKDGSKKIVEFHFAYDINKQWLAKSSGRLKTAIVGTIKTWLMVRTAKKYDKIVCLTKADLIRWRTDKIAQIYNPVTITTHTVSNCTSKIVVAMGRMDSQKGFDLLIDCWKLIEQKYPEWQLKIYGGGDSSIYEKQISDLQLNRVSFCGRTGDVPAALCEASIYVLSSRYEGFPLTIVEAMKCGLPIVTFDCPSGPAELVVDGNNGYVVNKVGDISAMAECLSKLIENEQLRKVFGKNSAKLSQKYHSDYVMGKWVALFKQLTEINL